MKLLSYLYIIFLTTLSSYSQIEFNGIIIQGEFSSTLQQSTPLNIEIIVINSDQDILYRENHENIEVYGESVFNLVLGEGNFISGTSNNISEINWFDVDLIKVKNLDNQNVLGEYRTLNRTYAYHSKYNLKAPLIIDLQDTQSSALEIQNILLKYNGSFFTVSNELISDSLYFSNYANWALYSDTSLFSLNNLLSDSSGFSYYSNNSNYSFINLNTINADSSIYSDTTYFSFNALNNWSLNGNELGNSSSFLGTTDSEDVVFRTNNNNKLTITKNGDITNLSNSNGIAFQSNGVLFNLNQPGGIHEITTHHLYMNQSKSATHIGSPLSNIDTLFGQNSFAFGNNSGTNGLNSTVFGNNSFGDSTLIFGAVYASNESFIVGGNCNASYLGTAIGHNANAMYFRTVALGKDVYAGPANGFTASAAIGIGNNVRSTGSTSWALGNNVTASGAYSYAIGTNSNSNLKIGSIVFGDYSTQDTVYNTENNQFMVRADSGFVFYTSGDLTMGVSLNHGDGSWNVISDQNKKENLSFLNPAEFGYFSKKIPVYSWQYINQHQIHIGPMAQDYNSTLGVGELPNYINSSDMDGSILLGIKNLDSIIKERDKSEDISIIEENIEEENNRLNDIEIKLEELYEKLDN